MNEKKVKEFIVKENQSALNVGSGDLEVLSTPYLLAFVENTCKEIITEMISDEDTSVGIDANFSHLAPSSIGNTIKVEATLVQQIKRIYSFEFKVYDKDTLISEGTHKRCVVNKVRFMEKLK